MFHFTAANVFPFLNSFSVCILKSPPEKSYYDSTICYIFQKCITILKFRTFSAVRTKSFSCSIFNFRRNIVRKWINLVLIGSRQKQFDFNVKRNKNKVGWCCLALFFIDSPSNFLFYFSSFFCHFQNVEIEYFMRHKTRVRSILAIGDIKNSGKL